MPKSNHHSGQTAKVILFLSVSLCLTAVSFSSQIAAQEAKSPAEFVSQLLSNADSDALKRYSGSAAERRVRLAGRAASAYDYEFDLNGLAAYQPLQSVEGIIRLWGNNYVGDSGLAQQWGEAFSRFHPDLTFEMVLPTAAVAAPSLYFGLADISMNHELTFYDYLAHRRILGYEPTGFSVVTGSYDLPGWQNTLVVVVHKDNPLEKISMKQLDGVFGSERSGGWKGSVWDPSFARGPDKNIRNWGELGLEGDWKDKTIHPYGYSLRYATALEFSNKVLGASDKWNEKLLAFGHHIDADGNRKTQVEQILEHMRNDPQGIAYIRWQPQFASQAKVLALATKTGGPYYDFTVENVQSRDYPLWGDQSLWVSVKPGTKIQPKVAEFIRFVLSREGQELIMKDGKYMPLPTVAVKKEMDKLEQLQ